VLLPTSGTLEEPFATKIRLMSAQVPTGYRVSAAARGRHANSPSSEIYLRGRSGMSGMAGSMGSIGFATAAPAARRSASATAAGRHAQPSYGA
jgi:hypothetical protein